MIVEREVYGGAALALDFWIDRLGPGHVLALNVEPIAWDEL